jgi:hypothetical protein
MMSPRTLYFGSRIINWECREHEFSDHDIETDFSVHSERKEGGALLAKQVFEVLRYPLRPIGVPEEMAVFYRAWDRFLSLYTEGRLTRREDRLIALAGIVDVVKRSTGLSMVFGLWKELLHIEILWVRDYYRDESKSISQQHSERAPSWSWASLEGPVHNAISNTLTNPPVFFIYNILYEESSRKISDNEVGLPGQCVLHLSGPLHCFQNLSIEDEDGDGSCTLHGEHETPVSFYPDHPDAAWSLKLLYGGTFCLFVSRCSSSIGHGEDDDEENDSFDVGLVLIKTTTGRYVRVGLFYDFQSPGKRLFENMSITHDIVIA